MRYIFAGDRDIAVKVLDHLMQQGFNPQALLLSADDRSSHANQLITLSQVPGNKVFKGKEFREETSFKILKELQVDYIIGIHFPYIIPPNFIGIPRIGFLNLHPAYLPFNKGWHTPSWAILEDTPIGATLHFMSEELDSGDIIHQKELKVLPNDTANSLYKRLKNLEFDVFKEALPDIISLNPPRISQKSLPGTSHLKKDLFNPDVQSINLDKLYPARTIINKLRALTTNSLDEAAYFIDKGRRYRIQVQIIEEKITK